MRSAVMLILTRPPPATSPAIRTVPLELIVTESPNPSSLPVMLVMIGFAPSSASVRIRLPLLTKSSPVTASGAGSYSNTHSYNHSEFDVCSGTYNTNSGIYSATGSHADTYASATTNPNTDARPAACASCEARAHIASTTNSYLHSSSNACRDTHA